MSSTLTATWISVRLCQPHAFARRENKWYSDSLKESRETVVADQAGRDGIHESKRNEQRVRKPETVGTSLAIALENSPPFGLAELAEMAVESCDCYLSVQNHA